MKLLLALDLGTKDYNLRLWQTPRGFEVGEDHDPVNPTGCWFQIFKDLDEACSYVVSEAWKYPKFSSEPKPKLAKKFLVDKKLLKT